MAAGREAALAWWEKGKQDIDVAEYNLAGGKLGAAAFYSEQAVEKALKALVILRFDEVSKTHELVALSRTLKAPKDIENLCAKINPAYTVTRYPDAGGDFDKSDVEEIFAAAKKVLKWVEKQW